MKESYEEIKVDKKELEIAKKQGKLIIYKMKIREEVEKFKENLEDNEDIEFYFSGENAITTSRKALQVAIMPMLGLNRDNWKSDAIIIITNRNMYVLNISSVLGLIDYEKVKKSEMLNLTYFRGEKLNVLRIMSIPKREFAIYIDKERETEYLGELFENFSVSIKNEEYQNWSKKALNYLLIFYLVFAIVLFILAYRLFKQS